MTFQIIDPVPLGIIHTDAYDDCREPLMDLISAEWRVCRLTLWGYRNNRPKSAPILDPHDLEIDWIAGPDRENGNPAYPELDGYHCDVGAAPRLRGYHDHGREAPDRWAELLIARADLDRLATSIPQTTRRVIAEWNNMVRGWSSTAPANSGPLKPAAAQMIRDAIAAVYDGAEATGAPPPNINEVVEPVQEKLRARGRSASKAVIQGIAQEYKARRRPRGRPIESSK
jgi:hypothetical protein